MWSESVPSTLDSDRTVAHRANDCFAMCSTFKAYAVGARYCRRPSAASYV